MKRIFYSLLLILILFLSACALYFPLGYDDDSYNYRIVFLVEPDNAQILVNGRLMGDVYEFSTTESALRLSSKDNEIIVKKKGYIEEVIDLYKYSSRDITIRLKLLKDKRYYKRKESKEIEQKREKLEYVAKSEKEKELPEKSEEMEIKVKFVNLILDVLPEESSIYINGKFWGISPKNGKIENLRLKAGKYTLEIIKPGYKLFVKHINISDQKELKLSVKLKK